MHVRGVANKDVIKPVVGSDLLNENHNLNKGIEHVI